MTSQLVTISLVAVIVILVVLAGALVGFVMRRNATAVEADEQTWRAMSSPPGGSPADSTGNPALVVPESPSEELLSPLTVVDYQPPAEPAPAIHLSAISLAERTKGFDRPIPTVVPEVVPVAEDKVVVAEPTPAPPVAEELAPAVTVAPIWQPSYVEPTPSPSPPSASPAQIVAPSMPAERPRANARPLPEAAVAVTPATLVWPDEPASPPARAEFVDMVAPVEMWFGDYRVGVKAGSKTHTQFRKYADALLGDLKGESERAR